MDVLREGAPARKALDAKRSEIAAKSDAIDATIRAEAADVDLLENCRRGVRAEIEKSRAELTLEQFRRGNAFLAAMDFPGMARYQNTVMPDLSWGVLFCLLGEERATQAVFDAAKRGAKEAPGLPNAAREAKIAELREQLKKLERSEELEILRLEAGGFFVLRREDITPAILFEVWQGYNEAPAPEPASVNAIEST